MRKYTYNRKSAKRHAAELWQNIIQTSLTSLHFECWDFAPPSAYPISCTTLKSDYYWYKT